MKEEEQGCGSFILDLLLMAVVAVAAVFVIGKTFDSTEMVCNLAESETGMDTRAKWLALNDCEIHHNGEWKSLREYLRDKERSQP